MKYKNSVQAEVMRDHIAACQTSGKTITTYCKEHSLVPSTFYYWQKRLSAASAAGGFSQVHPRLRDAVLVCIHYPNGVRIELSQGVNPSLLKELVCFI